MNLESKYDSNRRGANQRKSYTIDFKIKPLNLLNTMKELKTKKLWENVAVSGFLSFICPHNLAQARNR